MNVVAMFRSASLALFLAFAGSLMAWDYEAHRAINQCAMASLPTNFPAFTRTAVAAERVAFLAGEPDRWRNTPDLALKHANGPDHYIDVEELSLYGLKPQDLPVFRYDFVAQLALYRNKHPEKFQVLPSEKNEDHTRELIGLLPWQMVEMYGKLKSGFSYLKAFEQHGGTPEEIANAQENIIYIMGVMGHLFGDASQPLHTTIHHHGWVGENPKGYTTDHSIHSWIDGGFFQKNGGLDVQRLSEKMRTAGLVKIGGKAIAPENMFQAGVDFVVEQNAQVEPLYALEKAGKLSSRGNDTAAGREFLEGQMLKGAQFLGDAWYSAWQQATPDSFLIKQLDKRKRSPAAN